MALLYRAWRLVVLISVVVIAQAAAGDSFPFGMTLMLDAPPMRGSKRVPMLEIAENGAASIDLWCASTRAQAVVADHSITIAAGDLQNPQCDPDRQSRAMRRCWRRWRGSQIGAAMAKWSNFWA